MIEDVTTRIIASDSPESILHISAVFCEIFVKMLWTETTKTCLKIYAHNQNYICSIVQNFH